MSVLARVLDERHGDTPVVRIEGEVDASNARWIGSGLRTALTNRDTVLVLDLRATTYIDSAGIAMVFELAGELRAHQQELQLVVDPSSSIARMLRLAGVDRVMPVHPSLEPALSAPGSG